jgi:capsular exopolysaccharide synthesis family protein
LPPSLFKQLLFIALGLVVGMMGGGGLAFLFENLDRRLHTTADIEAATGLPILGEIPTARRHKDGGFLVDTLRYDDVFRRLRTSILSVSQGVSPKIFLITSAEPNEGKSTIVASLGRSMAQAGYTTVIVDADLYRPTVHRFFDCPNEVGLSSVLAQSTTLSVALRESPFSGLMVLTSGPPIPHPAELLGSDTMSALLEQLKKRFDIVLLDTPAFLGVADSAMLAPVVDGVVVVARCSGVSEGSLQAVCQQLAQMQARPVGVVVNRVKRAVPRRYLKYYEKARRDQVESKARIDRLTAPQPTLRHYVKVDAQRPGVHKPPLSELAQVPREGVEVKKPLAAINGIGPAYEKALNAIGILTLAQLAEQDPDDLANRIEVRLSAQRIRSERWIEQARERCNGESCGQLYA